MNLPPGWSTEQSGCHRRLDHARGARCQAGQSAGSDRNGGRRRSVCDRTARQPGPAGRQPPAWPQRRRSWPEKTSSGCVNCCRRRGKSRAPCNANDVFTKTFLERLQTASAKAAFELLPIMMDRLDEIDASLARFGSEQVEAVVVQPACQRSALHLHLRRAVPRHHR